MMKPFKNQKGLTLVELLGGLTLACILGVAVFATLINSLNLFERETNRIDVRGQANIIANQLTTFYQENGGFTVEPLGEGVKIISGEEAREYTLPGHQITVTVKPPIETGQFTKREIIIKITGDNEPFELITVVSRLREET